MAKEWSKNWKASIKPSKQRKYVKNAPLHIKSKMLVSTLSKDLRKKYNKRNARVVTGDKVKIMAGQFKGKENKVDHVDVGSQKVYVAGIEKIRMDGSKSLYPLHASNLMITSLNLGDKRREEALSRNIQAKRSESK